MTKPTPELPRTVDLPGEELQRSLAAAPSIPGQFIRALARAPFRPQGRLLQARADALRPIVVERASCKLDPDTIGRYRELCGYPNDHAVPSSYLETLFQPLMVEVVLSPAFPFSPLGLIHLHQHITQLGPIAADTTLQLSCSLAAVRQTQRGYELDCTMDARQDGVRCWRGLATLVSRDTATRRPSQGPRKPPRASSAGQQTWQRDQQVQVPADMGRRYAAVSGDYNPFHLWALTARPFGFRRPIAHGMWTLARALAFVEAGEDLPAAHQVKVSFKRPVFMPGSLTLRASQAVSCQDGSSLTFEARHPGKGHPHLIGQLSW